MPEPIRVALVNHTGRLGGGEFSMLHLVENLDPERVRLTIVTGEDGPFVDRLRELGADVVVAPLDPLLGERRKDSFHTGALLDPRLHRQLVRAVWPRADLLRKRRIQIVHTNSMKAHVLGGISGRAAGVRVLWHVRDHIAPPYLPAGAAHVMRGLARVLPHQVVAVSASAARTVGRRDVTVLHQSVPLPALNGERPATSRLRIGIVGRLAPWKGQDVFLAAAEQLAPRFPEAEFVLAGSALFGEDDFEHALRRRAENGVLSGRVRFLGFCNDVVSVYRNLDVAVHASTQAEPYGNVILEAMASRVPIVAAAAGGPLELIDHGRTGLLVLPGDPVALAAALERLLADPEERRRLGRAGREHVERNFSLERDARRLEELYRRLAA